MCVCIYGSGVGIRLPENVVTRLLETDPNAVPFRPMGRPAMREWVQVNLSCSEDYRHYAAVFSESIRHVMVRQEKKPT